MNDLLPTAAQVLIREADKASAYARECVHAGECREASRYYRHASQLREAALKLQTPKPLLLG